MKSLEINQIKNKNELLNIFLNNNEQELEKLSWAEIGQLPSWCCFICNKDLENEARSNYELFKINYHIFQYDGNRYYNLKENKVELVCNNICQEKLNQKSQIGGNEPYEPKITIFSVQKIEL